MMIKKIGIILCLFVSICASILGILFIIAAIQKQIRLITGGVILSLSLISIKYALMMWRSIQIESIGKKRRSFTSVEIMRKFSLMGELDDEYQTIYDSWKKLYNDIEKLITSLEKGMFGEIIKKLAEEIAGFSIEIQKLIKNGNIIKKNLQKIDINNLIREIKELETRFYEEHDRNKLDDILARKRNIQEQEEFYKRAQNNLKTIDTLIRLSMEGLEKIRGELTALLSEESLIDQKDVLHIGDKIKLLSSEIESKIEGIKGIID